MDCLALGAYKNDFEHNEDISKEAKILHHLSSKTIQFNKKTRWN